MKSIRKIVVTSKSWLSTVLLAVLFSLLAVSVACAQEPAVKVDGDGNTTVSGNLKVAGDNHDLNVDGKITAKGDTTVGGTLRVTGPGHDLNVDGNIRIGDTHLIYNSVNGVIDWGSSNNGMLLFRTVPTQGDSGGATMDRMTISSNSTVNIPGSLTVGSVDGDITVAGNASIRTGHLLLDGPTTRLALSAGRPVRALLFVLTTQPVSPRRWWSPTRGGLASAQVRLLEGNWRSLVRPCTIAKIRGSMAGPRNYAGWRGRQEVLDLCQRPNWRLKFQCVFRCAHQEHSGPVRRRRRSEDPAGHRDHRLPLY